MAYIYDPAVMQKFVESLYDKALMVYVRWIIACVIVAVIACRIFVVSSATHGMSSLAETQAAASQENGEFIFSVLAGALIGLWIGAARAFQFKLEAQRTLCQMQIEKNTRPVSLT